VTEEIDLNELIVRLRGDMRLYAETCLTILDKDSNFHLLKFNTAQGIVQEKLKHQLRTTGRIRAVILKARQEGVSTYTAARFFRSIHLWSGQSVLVVADSLDRAENLFAMYERYYEELPGELAPRRKFTERGRFMEFAHGSKISVRPASDQKAGRSFTLHKVHASELGFWGEHARKTWTSIMQAVPTGKGEVIVESTANGSGGLFHEMWESTQEPDSGWLGIFLPWWIHEEYELPVVDSDLTEHILNTLDDFERVALTEGIPYEGELHKLSINKLAWRRTAIAENFGGSVKDRPTQDAIRGFQVEYPATAEEAFLVSGSCFFDEDALRHMTLKTEEPIQSGKLMRAEDRTISLQAAERGPLRVWEKPTPELHYVCGADTASGKLVASLRSRENRMGEQEKGADRDASVAVIVSLPTKERGPKVVAELHGRLAPEVFTEQLRLLGELYSCGGGDTQFYRNKALIAVESNHSSGQTVLRLLKEHYRYVPLYWQREMNKRTRRMGSRLGWRTDEMTRMPMLDELARLVRDESWIDPSKDGVREMVTFITWPDGKPAADEGTHDDRVIARAIAAQMIREHRHSIDAPLPTYELADDIAG
jgi:hypothetical protein